MNLVDTDTGRRDVTIAQPLKANVLKVARALEPGDKIAIAFAGYADLIGAVTTIEPIVNDGVLDVNTDQGISVKLKEDADVLTYPYLKSGAVL
jgi:hypothetical protein